MAKKLWIDDIRDAPSAEWTIARTSEEAIAALSGEHFSHISFDHDLGGDDTSRRVVMWMCEQTALGTGFQWAEHLYVHSANPVGVEWLRGMLSRYAPVGSILH